MSGPHFHYDIPQNTAAWSNIRLGIPTASEMHRIITPKTGKLSTQVKPYRNRLLAEYILGRQVIEDPYESEFMEAGHDKEADTVKSFEFMSGMQTKEVGFVSVSVGDVMVLGCSPDRLIVDDDEKVLGTLEVKSPAPQTQVGYLLDPKTLSEKYWVQVQAQLWICELDFGYLHTDCKPLPPITPLRVNRDEKFIGELSGAIGLFLDDLMKCREQYVREYGLPERKAKPAELADPFFAGMEVSEADLEGWLNA